MKRRQRTPLKKLRQITPLIPSFSDEELDELIDIVQNEKRRRLQDEGIADFVSDAQNDHLTSISHRQSTHSASDISHSQRLVCTIVKLRVREILRGIPRSANGAIIGDRKINNLVVRLCGLEACR